MKVNVTEGVGHRFHQVGNEKLIGLWDDGWRGLRKKRAL